MQDEGFIFVGDAVEGASGVGVVALLGLWAHALRQNTHLRKVAREGRHGSPPVVRARQGSLPRVGCAGATAA